MSDITSHLHYAEITKDSESVLSSLQMVEREVNTDDSRTFLVRIIPYRTAEDHVNGVVITFFDISVRKETEEKLRDSEARFQGIISQTTAGISETDLS